jgi:hypothetical protein
VVVVVVGFSEHGGANWTAVRRGVILGQPQGTQSHADKRVGGECDVTVLRAHLGPISSLSLHVSSKPFHCCFELSNCSITLGQSSQKRRIGHRSRQRNSACYGRRRNHRCRHVDTGWSHHRRRYTARCHGCSWRFPHANSRGRRSKRPCSPATTATTTTAAAAAAPNRPLVERRLSALNGRPRLAT